MFQDESPEIKAPNYICHSTEHKPESPAKGIHYPDELPSSCQSFSPAVGPGCQRVRVLGDRGQTVNTFGSTPK